MACPMRKYPLTQPKNWTPPVPRWQLKLPENVENIFTTYIGVQQHNSNSSINAAWKDGVHQIEILLTGNEHSHNPDVVDTFTVQEGFDLPDSRVWVAYWTNRTAWEAATARLDLSTIYNGLSTADCSSIGLWLETFITPIERLETNYAGIHHKPGLGSLPDTDLIEHTLTAYWGAARDRMPASAYDLYEPPLQSSLKPPAQIPRGLGQHLAGTNYDNIVHIRSGQIWSQCPEAERVAYETILEPTLMQGMRYLWSHALDTGTVGLRFLRNIDESGTPIKETCGAGFFRNLEDLEKWAKRHKSHLAIFNGAHKHAKDWGGDRRFMTWHEVSVLKKGEARWEYLNCKPETGVIRWVQMEEVEEIGELNGQANGNEAAKVN